MQRMRQTWGSLSAAGAGAKPGGSERADKKREPRRRRGEQRWRQSRLSLAARAASQPGKRARPFVAAIGSGPLAVPEPALVVAAPAALRWIHLGQRGKAASTASRAATLP